MHACSTKLIMAGNSVEEIALAFFVTECRGVKFYDIKDGKLGFGTELSFVRRPNHLMDSNCVEVRVVERRRQHGKLGHVKAEAAEWLSPLLAGPFTITG
jgi:hypothetical protein